MLVFMVVTSWPEGPAIARVHLVDVMNEDPQTKPTDSGCESASKLYSLDIFSVDMAAPWNRAGHYILPCGFLLSSIFLSLLFLA